MSNGGMFAQRLACERPDLFDAIGAVAGTNNFAACDPAEPISILHIHSLQDDHILFEGGCGPACVEDTDYVSVPDTIAGWVAWNNCNATPQHVEINENAYAETYSGCDGNVEVKLIVTRDGGHSWPGGSSRSNGDESGAPSHAISATDEIWSFFEQAALQS
jgi:polyhydroxybutyrate depolymerase